MILGFNVTILTDSKEKAKLLIFFFCFYLLCQREGLIGKDKTNIGMRELKTKTNGEHNRKPCSKCV